MVAVLGRCRCGRGCSGCGLARLWGRAAWPGCGAGLRRGRRPASLMVLLVAPRVFRVLRVLCKAGSGCLVCPWAAARPRVVRAASFARSGRSRSPPVPSGPSGTLHTSGAWLLVRRVDSLSGQAPPPPTGAASWPSGSSGARNTSDGGGFALHEAFWWRVAGVSDAHVVQFPPFGGVASHGYRVWALSTGRPGVSETVIVFAGEQWCWWFQCRHVVAPRARHFSPCSARCGCEREKVLPASLVDRESAKKFALCAQIGPNSAFLRVLAELFRGRATGGAVLGEFFRANRCCAQDL